MSEEDLELLITLDDPQGAPEEEIFIHSPENTIELWIGQSTTTRRQRETMEAVKKQQE